MTDTRNSVNVCSVLRLITLIDTQAGTYPTLDPSWYGCTPIILSALEVHLATICASLPVFWPIIKDSFAIRSITVTREIEITRETRDFGDWQVTYEMAMRSTEAMVGCKRKVLHHIDEDVEQAERPSISTRASVSAPAAPTTQAYMNMIFTKDGRVDAALSYPSQKKWIEHQLIGLDGGRTGKVELDLGRL